MIPGVLHKRMFHKRMFHKRILHKRMFGLLHKNLVLLLLDRCRAPVLASPVSPLLSTFRTRRRLCAENAESADFFSDMMIRKVGGFYCGSSK